MLAFGDHDDSNQICGISRDIEASVRGLKVGKTPVLDLTEARTLLERIDVTTPAGLRGRALTGLMVYSFAHDGATLAMKVEDVHVQNRPVSVRLHEKGGERHEIPCHHNLEACASRASGHRRSPKRGVAMDKRRDRSID